MAQYAYQNQAETLRKNTEDLLAAQQSYTNNQFADYQKAKTAYDKYNDMQARSQATAEAESQHHQHEGGWWKGALKGGATGAGTAGMMSAGNPWAALAGGVVGAVGGGIMGASDDRSADRQFKSTMRDIKNAPFGMVSSADPGITGNGLMDAGTWEGISNAGVIAGMLGKGAFKSSFDPANKAQDRNTLTDTGLEGSPTNLDNGTQIASPFAPMTKPNVLPSLAGPSLAGQVTTNAVAPATPGTPPTLEELLGPEAAQTIRAKKVGGAK